VQRVCVGSGCGSAYEGVRFGDGPVIASAHTAVTNIPRCIVGGLTAAST
jgi:hypothetical protein